MEISLETVLNYRKMLERYAEELWEIHRKLALYQASLQEAWEAPETEEILDMAAELAHQAARLSDELSGIGFDMLKACEEFMEKSQAEGSL